MPSRAGGLAALLATVLLAPGPLGARQATTDTIRPAPDSVTKVAKLAPLTITASRSLESVFRTASPILALDSSVVRLESPNGVGDLFRNLPGVDVTGVGPNQTRLAIRGQRGQRILLAEDGIRLNNSRRQQDFGELPAFTDINGISRVEVLRGPASVLYGTDAIGGVVNQVTQRYPGAGTPNGVSGSLQYRYSGAGDQQLVHGQFGGRTGRLGIAATIGYRDAAPYLAPAGTFGNLTLAEQTLVNDTGVLDRTYGVELGYDFSDTRSLAFRLSHYDADNAGFGYVAPTDLGTPGAPTIRLRYPQQDVTRATLAYRASALSWEIADRLELTAYTTQNDRVFAQDLEIPFGAPLPPTAGIRITGRNVTDIATYGVRTEAAKVVGGRHHIRYGADWYVDRVANADTATTTTTTFGPPTVRTSTTPTLPDASLWSGGLYAQSEWEAAPTLTLGLGLRGQLIHSETRATEGLPATRAGLRSDDGTLVGGVNASWNVVPSLNLVGSAGRAFRAPNLIERYFDGVSSDGSGYQVANPDIEPETSFNVEFGVKYRRNQVYVEVLYFTNEISGGIRSVPLADSTIGRLPVYQTQNIETIRDRGVEALLEVGLGRGFTMLAHGTSLTSKNSDENSPVGDGYSSKVGGEVRWQDPRGRFFAAYEVRHQGERDDVELAPNPIGEVIPSFTTQTARAGIRLPTFGGTATSLNLAVVNLGNALYSEASNTSFFRPEPGRHAVVTLRLDF